MPKDKVRVPAGRYEGNAPPSPAEQDPLVNGIRGGILKSRYLDTSTLDANRIMGCETTHTTNYTLSKLTRAKVGPLANPNLPEIEPDIAESWDASPDATQFTFHLRRGVKTHNVNPTFGREYTAEDVKLTFERYKAGGVQKDVFAPVASMETPDQYTVKVKLSQPIADFPTELAPWSVLFVKELLGNQERLNEESVGTGPFVLTKWVKKEHSDFVRHPEYREKGLPFLDGVTVSIQNDAAVQSSGFQTDNYFDWSSPNVDAVETMARQVKDMVFVKAPRSRGANVNGFHFQMQNKDLQDIRVRRAISLAFDADEYDRAQNGGDNQSPDGAFCNPPMPWPFLYDKYPTRKSNGPWYDFDPQKASQLMRAAGYSKENPLEFELVTFFSRTQISQLVVPGINKSLPEVKIKFRQVDDPTHMQLLVDRNFTAASGIVWGPPGYSMDQWIYPWYHTKGGLNYNSKGNADLDTLLEQQRSLTSLPARKEVWQKVWDTIHDQVWDLWFPESLLRTAYHNYVLNFRNHNFMGSYSCYTSDQARAMWLDEGAPMRA